jgi:hypothetical protein
MKKILTVTILALLTMTVFPQSRPLRIGIKGGINYIHLENFGTGYYADFESRPGWNVGILAEFTRGHFLNYSVAPELIFTESRTDVDLIYATDYSAVIRSVDLPVNFRLGLQLSKIFRPYLLGNIYGSYIVSSSGGFFELLDIDQSDSEKSLRKFYFGMSAGMGFDLWKFQIEGRYRWNLTKVNTDDFASLRQIGLELSCAILF